MVEISIELTTFKISAMHLQDRLKTFIEYKGLTYKAFEQMCGFGNGSAKKFHDPVKKRTSDSIASTFPDLNILWLLTGEGKMLNENFIGNAKIVGGVYSVGSNDKEVSKVVFVPVSAHATFIENLDIHEEMESYPVVLTKSEKDEIDKYKIFEVEGDSMFPSISNGALILSKEIPEKNWCYAEGVVVIIFSEYVVVKRIEKNDLLINNMIVLSSDNDKYGKLTVQLSDIRAIYKAKRILSSEIK